MRELSGFTITPCLPDAEVPGEAEVVVHHPLPVELQNLSLGPSNLGTRHSLGKQFVAKSNTSQMLRRLSHLHIVEE